METQNKKLRVLVGDDEIGVACSLQQKAFLRNYEGLADFDFEKDSNMFIERAKIGKYDALLIDLCWENADREREDKTGYKVLKEVEHYAPIRLLHTSEDETLRKKGMQFGATTCIEKHRSPEYLRTALEIQSRLDSLRDLNPKDPDNSIERLAKFFDSLKQVPIRSPVSKRSEMDNWYSQSHRLYALQDKQGIPIPLRYGNSPYLYEKQEWCAGPKCDCGNSTNLLEIRLLADAQVEEFFQNSVGYDHIIARNISLYGVPSPILEIQTRSHPRDKSYQARIEFSDINGRHEQIDTDFSKTSQLINKIREARVQK